MQGGLYCMLWTEFLLNVIAAVQGCSAQAKKSTG